jgi:hypothetical protein
MSALDAERSRSILGGVSKGSPEMGAETRRGKSRREPFEPDPDRTGVGTGTAL